MNTALDPPKTNTILAALLAAESELFLREYQNYYREGESKPPDIGMPYFPALA